ncbi:MAG: hypothetical protein ACRD3P_01525 [Terriglobales bacterium]
MTRVEPDGIVLKTKSGISKLYFTELPKEVHDRFLGNNAFEQDLQARYSQLQQQEQQILQQIGTAEQAKEQLEKTHPRPSWTGLNDLAAQLPALHKQLDDVRAGKDDAKRQLEKAQRALQAPPPQNNIQALQARYFELEQQEDELKQKIEQARVGEYQSNPDAELHAQLPSLYKELDDVRREKDQIRKQAEQR